MEKYITFSPSIFEENQRYRGNASKIMYVLGIIMIVWTYSIQIVSDTLKTRPWLSFI